LTGYLALSSEVDYNWKAVTKSILTLNLASGDLEGSQLNLGTSISIS